jgi:transposase
LTNKIHALVDGLGNPVEVMLSPGQDHDLTCAEPLIEAVDPAALIADKAFDADAFIAALNDRAIVPVIPSKSNRTTPRRARDKAAAQQSDGRAIVVVNLTFGTCGLP